VQIKLPNDHQTPRSHLYLLAHPISTSKHKRKSEDIAQELARFSLANVRFVKDQKAVELVFGPLRGTVRAERRLESCCGRYRKVIEWKS